MRKYLIKKEDGGVGVLYLIEGAAIESEIAKWEPNLQAQYISHREINDEDLPTDRVFREAWVDVTESSRIDISCEKARNIKLIELREKRKEEFNKLGVPIKLAPELEEALLSEETKQKLQELRDITEPLKALQVIERFNDESLLNQIKQLSLINHE